MVGRARPDRRAVVRDVDGQLDPCVGAAREELVEAAERRVGHVVQHHDRPREPLDVCERVRDPSDRVEPVPGHRVPQHARAAVGDQALGAVPAHQPIVDGAAGSVRSEQLPVAAGVGDRPAAVIELAIDVGIAGVAERHRVAPRVRTDQVPLGDGLFDEPPAGDVDHVAADDEEHRFDAVTVQHVVDPLGHAGGRPVVDRQCQLRHAALPDAPVRSSATTRRSDLRSVSGTCCCWCDRPPATGAASRGRHLRGPWRCRRPRGRRA